MPKSIFIIILLFLINFNYFSQGGWKKKYYMQNSITSACRNVIEAPNGNFIAIGVTYDTMNNQGFNRLTLMGTDIQGNVLWRKNYGSIKFEYLDAISNSKVLDNSGFYVTVCVRDSNNNYLSSLIKFDYSGDSLWQKRYYSGQSGVSLYLNNVAKSVDGGFLLTGFYASSQEPCLIIKTNINGIELWRHLINKVTPNVNRGQSIVQDTGSKKIIVVGGQYIGNSASWDVYSSIIILDSLGNNPIRKIFNNAGGGDSVGLFNLKIRIF